jgi:hypothetical protein
VRELFLGAGGTKMDWGKVGSAVGRKKEAATVGFCWVGGGGFGKVPLGRALDADWAGPGYASYLRPRYTG